MFSNKELVSISHKYLKNKISNKLNIEIDSIHTIIKIGSCVYPITMRKKSDIDLVYFLEDKNLDCPKIFKAGYQTNSINYQQKVLTIPIDVKLYSIASFREEMYHGSLTRAFAILNAFKIIYSKDNTIRKIISDAEKRIYLTVNLTKDNLKKLNIPDEMKNIENYFNDALSVLLSEKIKDNLILINLRLFEYLKDFIIQFQRILLAIDIQNQSNLNNINAYIRNLIVFKNSDGTRLLDHKKYLLDSRVKTSLKDLNSIFMKSDSFSIQQLIASIFNCISSSFFKHTGYSLLRTTKHYEYFSVDIIKIID